MKGGAPPLIWAMTTLFAAVEGLFALSDAGLIAPGLRFEAYARFAFFDRYFEAAGAGVAVPTAFWASFVTHAFMHGGLVHLLMNGAVFLALGGHVARAIGQGATLALFLGTAAAGAVFFGAIADTGWVPMVGASGAIFGFFGAVKRWEWRFLRAGRLPLNRFWSTMAGLVLINVLLAVGFAAGGAGIAWEAHLGGFVAGWFAAGWLRPRGGDGPAPI